MNKLVEYFHKNHYSDLPIEDVASHIYANEENYNNAISHVYEKYYSDLPQEKKPISKKSYQDITNRILSSKAGEQYWQEAKSYIEKKDWEKLKKLIDINKAQDGLAYYTPLSFDFIKKTQAFENQHRDSGGSFYSYKNMELPKANFFKEFDVDIDGKKTHFKIPIYGNSGNIEDIEKKYYPTDGTWAEFKSSINKYRPQLDLPGSHLLHQTLDEMGNNVRRVFMPSENIDVDTDTGDGGNYNNNNNNIQQGIQELIKPKNNIVLVQTKDKDKNQKKIVLNNFSKKQTAVKQAASFLKNNNTIEEKKPQVTEAATLLNNEPLLLWQGSDFFNKTGLKQGNYSITQVKQAMEKRGYKGIVKDNKNGQGQIF